MVRRPIQKQTLIHTTALMDNHFQTRNEYLQLMEQLTANKHIKLAIEAELQKQGVTYEEIVDMLRNFRIPQENFYDFISLIQESVDIGITSRNLEEFFDY